MKLFTGRRCPVRAFCWILILAAAVLLAGERPARAQQASETVLHSFSHPDQYGLGPQANLIQASDGNLYGTTYQGGAYGGGTVYKIAAAGAETVLYSFGATSGDGENPQAGLIQASDGNLYGTTYRGGAYDDAYGFGAGTVFKISLAGTETVLYSFGGTGGDAVSPSTGLIQASDGNLYGTTEEGGEHDYGTVFEVTLAGAEMVLYSFGGTSVGDGQNPVTGLIQASDGNLYGTTGAGGAYGGVYGDGTLFRITLAGAETVLHSFGGTSDGTNPQAGLIQASDGNLYGTTSEGGAYGYEHGVIGSGSVFRITLAGDYSVLYSFSGSADAGGDGYKPESGLIQASDGNLYGTTYQGGAYGDENGGYGTVFRITLMGAESVVYSFSGPDGDGIVPYAGLIQASDGNLYGTTYRGGAYGDGTVFRITPAGAETVLYSFGGTSIGDGAGPEAGLIQASDGNLYGTTIEGGAYGAGTVFKITLAGAETVIYSFGATSGDGYYPQAGLIQASDGNLYGTTPEFGAHGVVYSFGTAFKISLAGAETVLHSFGASSGDGQNPEAGVIQASDGNLYGTTFYGGYYDGPEGYGAGTVFKITLAGAETVLYSFGATSGDGYYPQSGLVQASDGNLYGTTYRGGAYDSSSVFDITLAGAETVLYSFGATSGDGAGPEAGLIQASDGNLYGTTEEGGAYDSGTVFALVVPPTIASLSETSGLAGDSVTITGTNFVSVSSVTFGGVAASYTVSSATSIIAVAPLTGISGPVKVTTPGGTATGPTFTYEAPTITSFTPTSGSAGTSVAITGTGLAGISSVKFNGTAATTWTPSGTTSVTAVVPAGATPGPITITTPGGTATSAASFYEPPTIASLSETSGLAGDSVTITGTNFVGVSSVTFGGVAASYTVGSATSIIAVAPLTGISGPVKVTTLGGTATGPTFTYEAPTITSFTPTSGRAGTSVTIIGTGLIGVSWIKFGSAAVSNWTRTGTTTLTTVVPAGASTGKITLATPGGIAISQASFSVTPTITSLSETLGLAGDSVTITGTNFVSVSSVTFGGVAASYTANSATSIVAVAPLTGISGPVKVTTPGGTATGPTFTYEAPTITSFAPTIGKTGTPVTVTGMGLIGMSSIKFNGTAATTWTRSGTTSVSTVVPAGATPGPITITTPGGTATSAASFYEPPTIASLSETSGLAGDSVTITGTNFVGVSSVTFGGVAASYTVSSATSIVAVAPLTGISGPVKVTTPGGTATGPTFTYEAPTITSFAPTIGKTGTPVTVTGMGLIGMSSIKFNGTAATTWTRSGTTSVSTVVPAGATPGPITITTPGGTATSAASFYEPPTITSFTPAWGPAGTLVTIAGTNLIGISSVKFNGTVSTSWTRTGTTKIAAVVPAGAATGKITITTSGGTATSATEFTVN